MTWQEFIEAYGCKHPRKEIRKQLVKRVGKPSYLMGEQCLNCGFWRKVPALKGSHLAMLPERDYALETDGRERLHATWQGLIAQEQQQQNAQWWRWYNQYLESPEWRMKRKQVLLRAKGMCEGCQAQVATQVHHLTYAHVGKELLFELVAICNACHEIVHADREHT